MQRLSHNIIRRINDYIYKVILEKAITNHLFSRKLTSFNYLKLSSAEWSGTRIRSKILVRTIHHSSLNYIPYVGYNL